MTERRSRAERRRRLRIVRLHVFWSLGVLTALFCGSVRAVAQAPAAATPPAQEAAAAAPAAEQAPAPAAKEEQTTGSIDLGYRWLLGKGGNDNVYRSIINLGEGPKLLDTDLSLRRPVGRLYNRLDLHATSWGGDPYNTARLDVERTGLYSLYADYRNVHYFNNLPSFANPVLGSGVLFSERALDTQRRSFDSELIIRPGARISPYLAYSHNSGFGTGITTFVADNSQFPVRTQLGDSTNSYRGGVHINFAKLNVTLEQGGTTFRDDQQAGYAGAVNPGAPPLTILGQPINLKSLNQAYGARGNGIFDRAVVEARPWSKLTFTGQFLYSKPSINVNYLQQDTGNFVLLSALQVYTGELDRSVGDASRPRSSGNASVEFRPIRRLRIIESWSTDRFHIAAGSFLGQTLISASSQLPSATSGSTLLVLNTNRQQVDVIFDVASFLTLRGGHRYEWGDATIPASALTPNGEVGDLGRQVGLAGATLRFGSKIDINADLEASSASRTFFRTDLADYQRGKVRARYRMSKLVTLTSSYGILNNQNTSPGVNLDFQSRESGVAVFLTPNDGKRFSFLLDYSRITVRSQIPYLAPQDRTQQISSYRDDGHYGGASVEMVLFRGARLNLGGSFAATSGSRPTRFYQPQGRLVAPLFGRVSWITEWRWFGYDEAFFGIENFHTHLFSTGVRIKM